MNKFLLSGLLTVCALVTLVLLSYGDQVSYGKVYIKNNTDWSLKITADLKDAWDNITETDWSIATGGVEVLDNLYWLKNIRFQVEAEDQSKLEPWLRKTYPILLRSQQEGKDLIIYIAKNRFGKRWEIEQRYVTAAKIEYGGPSGYSLKIEIP